MESGRTISACTPFLKDPVYQKKYTHQYMHYVYMYLRTCTIYSLNIKHAALVRQDSVSGKKAATHSIDEVPNQENDVEQVSERLRLHQLCDEKAKVCKYTSTVRYQSHECFVYLYGPSMHAALWIGC